MRGGIYPSCTPREDENLLEALASLLKSFSLPSSHPPNSVGGSGPYSESPLGQVLLGQRLSCPSQGICFPTLSFRDVLLRGHPKTTVSLSWQPLS